MSPENKSQISPGYAISLVRKLWNELSEDQRIDFLNGLSLEEDATLFEILRPITKFSPAEVRWMTGVIQKISERKIPGSKPLINTNPTIH